MLPSGWAAFARMDGILGDATEPKHKDQIDAFGYGYGVSNDGAIAQPALGSFTDFALVKYLDRATTALLDRAVSGATIATVSIDLITTSDWLQRAEYNFKGVTIKSVQPASVAGYVSPLEIVRFSFTGIQVRYFVIRSGTLHSIETMEWNYSTGG